MPRKTPQRRGASPRRRVTKPRPKKATPRKPAAKKATPRKPAAKKPTPAAKKKPAPAKPRTTNAALISKLKASGIDFTESELKQFSKAKLEALDKSFGTDHDNTLKLMACGKSPDCVLDNCVHVGAANFWFGTTASDKAQINFQRVKRQTDGKSTIFSYLVPQGVGKRPVLFCYSILELVDHDKQNQRANKDQREGLLSAVKQIDAWLADNGEETADYDATMYAKQLKQRQQAEASATALLTRPTMPNFAHRHRLYGRASDTVEGSFFSTEARERVYEAAKLVGTPGEASDEAQKQVGVAKVLLIAIMRQALLPVRSALDSATNVWGVRHAKHAVGSALGTVYPYISSFFQYVWDHPLFINNGVRLLTGLKLFLCIMFGHDFMGLGIQKKDAAEDGVDVERSYWKTATDMVILATPQLGMNAQLIAECLDLIREAALGNVGVSMFLGKLGGLFLKGTMLNLCSYLTAAQDPSELTQWLGTGVSAFGLSSVAKAADAGSRMLTKLPRQLLQMTVCSTASVGSVADLAKLTSTDVTWFEKVMATLSDAGAIWELAAGVWHSFIGAIAEAASREFIKACFSGWNVVSRYFPGTNPLTGGENAAYAEARMVVLFKQADFAKNIINGRVKQVFMSVLAAFLGEKFDLDKLARSAITDEVALQFGRAAGQSLLGDMNPARNAEMMKKYPIILIRLVFKWIPTLVHTAQGMTADVSTIQQWSDFAEAGLTDAIKLYYDASAFAYNLRTLADTAYDLCQDVFYCWWPKPRVTDMELDVTIVLGLTSDVFLDDTKDLFSDAAFKSETFNTATRDLFDQEFIRDNKSCLQILNAYIAVAHDFALGFTPLPVKPAWMPPAALPAALSHVAPNLAAIKEWYKASGDHDQVRAIREAKRAAWFADEGTFSKLLGLPLADKNQKPIMANVARMLKRIRALEKQLQGRINSTCCAASFARRLKDVKRIIAPEDLDETDAPCEPDTIQLQYNSTGRPLHINASGCGQNCAVKSTKTACEAVTLGTKQLCTWKAPSIDDSDKKELGDEMSDSLQELCQFNPDLESFTQRWKDEQQPVGSGGLMSIIPSFDHACGLETPFMPAAQRLKLPAYGCTNLIGNEGAVAMKLQLKTKPNNSKGHWTDTVQQLHDHMDPKTETKPCIADDDTLPASNKVKCTHTVDKPARYAGEINRVDLWAALETRRLQLLEEQEKELLTNYTGGEIVAARMISKRWESVRLYELFLRGGAAVVEGVSKTFDETNTAQGLLNAVNTIRSDSNTVQGGGKRAKVDLMTYSVARGCAGTTNPEWWNKDDNSLHSHFSDTTSLECVLGKAELQLRIATADTVEAIDGMTVRALGSLDRSKWEDLAMLFTEDTYPTDTTNLRPTWSEYKRRMTPIGDFKNRISKLKECIGNSTSASKTNQDSKSHELTCHVEDNTQLHLLAEIGTVSKLTKLTTPVTLYFPPIPSTTLRPKNVTIFEWGVCTSRWKEGEGQPPIQAKYTPSSKEEKWSIVPEPTTSSPPYLLGFANIVYKQDDNSLPGKLLKEALQQSLLEYLRKKKFVGTLARETNNIWRIDGSKIKIYPLIHILNATHHLTLDHRYMMQRDHLCAALNDTEVIFPKMTKLPSELEVKDRMTQQVWYGSFAQLQATDKRATWGNRHYDTDPTHYILYDRTLDWLQPKITLKMNFKSNASNRPNSKFTIESGKEVKVGDFKAQSKPVSEKEPFMYTLNTVETTRTSLPQVWGSEPDRRILSPAVNTNSLHSGEEYDVGFDMIPYFNMADADISVGTFGTGKLEVSTTFGNDVLIALKKMIRKPIEEQTFNHENYGKFKNVGFGVGTAKIDPILDDELSNYKTFRINLGQIGLKDSPTRSGNVNLMVPVPTP